MIKYDLAVEPQREGLRYQVRKGRYHFARYLRRAKKINQFAPFTVESVGSKAKLTLLI